MHWAIFSDIHGNVEAFHGLLAELERHPVDRMICLGDVGRGSGLLAELRQQEIPCVFGNWEVSALPGLGADLADWVGDWPATIQMGEAIFCHATPDMPATAQTTAAARRYMKERNVGWQDLFPPLHQNQDALWSALASLEVDGLRVAFHGHTHLQTAWGWLPDPSANRQLRPLSQPEFVLEPAPARYVVGVGSLGQPQDGSRPRFVRYDDSAGVVTLAALA